LKHRTSPRLERHAGGSGDRTTAVTGDPQGSRCASARAASAAAPTRARAHPTTSAGRRNRLAGPTPEPPAQLSSSRSGLCVPVLLRLQPSHPNRRDRLDDGYAQRGNDIQVALQSTRQGFKGVILLGSDSDFKAYRDVFQVVTKPSRPNKSLRVIYLSSLVMFIHTEFT
jgi:hypothetical protein